MEQIMEAWRNYGFRRNPVLVSFAKDQAHEDSAGDLIVQRCVDAMVNEAVRIVGERALPEDLAVDVLAVQAIGFPAFRGGPLWQASDSGFAETLDRIVRYREESQSDWNITPHWQDRVDPR